MRLFLTSYQKSGTHQIMPALGIFPDIVDRSQNSISFLSPYLEEKFSMSLCGIDETCQALRDFQGRAFGHVSYLPEFVDAIQFIPTKVIFNIRDPRDVIVAEYYNIMKAYPENMTGWPDFILADEKCYVSRSSDPISHLIDFAVRWKAWLGWLKEDFVYTVHYEDLRTDGMTACLNMVDWIRSHGIETPDANVMYKRLRPRRDNPTFRKGLVGEWKDIFTAEHKQKAERVLGDIITEMGYNV